MHPTRPASAARGASATPAPSTCDPTPQHKSAGVRVGALNQSDGAWERTFNCEDSDSDLRDFWAIVLEGTSRAKLQVNCAPFVVLDANFEPSFVLQQQQLPEKKAASAAPRSATGGAMHVAGMYIDGSSSDGVWAAVQKQIESWPRIALKQRIADAAPEKGAKGLSSTQLLLAQLVSGGVASNPLEVAKTIRHELVPNARAVAVAEAAMRSSQRRTADDDEVRRAADSSAALTRKKSISDGQRVIQVRERDDSGQVIDYSICAGVAGFKCVAPAVHPCAPPPRSKLCRTDIGPQNQWSMPVQARRRSDTSLSSSRHPTLTCWLKWSRIPSHPNMPAAAAATVVRSLRHMQPLLPRALLPKSSRTWRLRA